MACQSVCLGVTVKYKVEIFKLLNGNVNSAAQEKSGAKPIRSDICFKYLYAKQK